MGGWQTIIDGFSTHPKLSAALAVLGIAFASSMPEEYPRTFQDWWAWLRSGLQSSIPIHRFPTQPGGPAQTK